MNLKHILVFLMNGRSGGGRAAMAIRFPGQAPSAGISEGALLAFGFPGNPVKI